MVDGIRRVEMGEWRGMRALKRRVHVVIPLYYGIAPRRLLPLLLSILLQFAWHEYSSPYFHFLFHFVVLHILLLSQIYMIFLFLFFRFFHFLSVSAKHLCLWQTGVFFFRACCLHCVYVYSTIGNGNTAKDDKIYMTGQKSYDSSVGTSPGILILCTSARRNE